MENAWRLCRIWPLAYHPGQQWQGLRGRTGAANMNRWLHPGGAQHDAGRDRVVCR